MEICVDDIGHGCGDQEDRPNDVENNEINTCVIVGHREEATHNHKPIVDDNQFAKNNYSCPEIVETVGTAKLKKRRRSETH